MESLRFQALFPEEYYRKFVTSGVRPDGRSLARYRPASIALGILSNTSLTPPRNDSMDMTQDNDQRRAWSSFVDITGKDIADYPPLIGGGGGSSVVKLGRTCVVCGIMPEVGIPRDHSNDGDMSLSNSNNNGWIEVVVETPPLSSSMYNSNRPSEAAMMISQRIKKKVDVMNVINTQQLGIVPGQSVWVLHAHILVVCDDGNIGDAAMLALMGALSDVVLPAVEILESGEVVLSREQVAEAQSLDSLSNAVYHPMKRLRLNRILIPATFCVFSAIVADRTIESKDIVVVDPCADEEALSSTIVTVTYDGQGILCGMDMLGGNPINTPASNPALSYMSELSKQWVEDWVRLLAEAVGRAGMIVTNYIASDVGDGLFSPRIDFNTEIK